MPVIKNFRYLFKTMFIYIPLFPVLAAYTIEHIFKRKYVYFVMGCFVCLGICNNIFITTSGTHLHYKNDLDNDLKRRSKEIRKELTEKDIDVENYRMVSFLENRNGTDLWNHYTADISIARNYPIMIGVYTLGGFDNSFDDVTYMQSRGMLNDSNFEFEIMNAVASEQFFERSKEDDTYITDINNNAVKYLVFEKESKYLKDFEALIEQSSQLEISREIEVMKDKVILELKNIPSLAQNENQQKLELHGGGDYLVVELEEVGAENIRLAFTCYNQIQAGYYYNDTFYELEVQPDDSGYIVIAGVDSIPDSVREIKVFYQNRLFDFMNIESLLIGLVAVSLMLYLMLGVQTRVQGDQISEK